MFLAQNSHKFTMIKALIVSVSLLIYFKSFGMMMTF